MPLINRTTEYSMSLRTVQCQKYFDFLKYSLTVVPLLVHPDTKKVYLLFTGRINQRREKKTFC